MKILLIEDDHQLGSSLEKLLKIKGHLCTWSQDIKSASEQLEVVDFDLLIVDWMLPDGEGKDFIVELRENDYSMPILMLTARREVKDRVEGLNAGSDDYLTKPFDIEELVARVDALARRSVVKPKATLSGAGLNLKLSDKTLEVGEQTYHLSATECYIIEVLLNHLGFYVSKSELESRLRSRDKDIGYNAIEAHISRIRNKIGKDKIKTLRGVGYKVG
jgi:DNA-binding response OmpR family regulator